MGVNTKSGGLPGLYARRANFEVFRPITVDGYPALVLDPKALAGSCNVSAAVNPMELVFADVMLENLRTAPRGQACDLAVPLLESIIRTTAG